MHITLGKNSLQRYMKMLCLLLILVVGMFLRLGTADLTVLDHPVRNDAKDYVAYAWNLKFYGIYSRDISTLIQAAPAVPKPDAMRPPGYPWLLSALLDHSVDSSFVSRVIHVQAWIAGLTLLCSVLLAMELLGAWAGLLVGALVAISPHQSVYVADLLTETLYGAVLMLALGAGVLTLNAQRFRWRCTWAWLAGLLFGMTCLVRPTLNQWVPLLLLLLLLPRMRRFHREILALALGFVLIMMPWWLRNEASLHQVSDSYRMMVTVHQGSYPDFMFDGNPKSFGFPYMYDPDTIRVESSWANVFTDLRTKFANKPLAMTEWYLVGKPVYFFRWSPPDGWGGMFTYSVLRSPWLSESVFILITAIAWQLYWPLIICGILGTLVAFAPKTRTLFGARKADGLRLLALLHLFAIGVHIAGAPFARYSVPFRPVTFLLAIFFLVWVARSYVEWRQQRLVCGDRG